MIPGTSAALDASLSFVQGDTWGGIPSLTILVSGSPPSDDVASAIMQFTTGGQTPRVLTISSADATQINITSASAWTFSVPAQDIDLLQGTYSWAFQTTDVNGVVQTYLQGKIAVLAQTVNT